MKTLTVLSLYFTICSATATLANEYTWQKVQFPVKIEDTSSLNAIKALDSYEAIAVGNNGVIINANWFPKTYSPQHYGSNALTCVAFADHAHGWAAGEKGTIYVTVDNGKTWTLQTSGINATCNAVIAIDTDNVWIATDDAGILKTSNGGKMWEYLDMYKVVGGKQDIINNISITFKDRDHVYVGANRGSGANVIAFITCNGGTSWNQLRFDDKTFGLGEVKFLEDTLCFYIKHFYDNWHITLSDSNECMIKTKVLPISIQNFGNISNMNFSSRDYAGSQTSWIAGAQGSIYRTSDNGSSWYLLGNNQYVDDLDCVCFKDPANGFIGGNNGTFLFTNDSGKSWKSKFTTGNVSNDFNNIVFTDSLHGMLFFKHQNQINRFSIFTTNDGGESWNVNDVNSLKCCLSGPYPAGNGKCLVMQDRDGFRFTTDNGVSWDSSAVKQTYSERFQDLYVFNKDTFFLAGYRDKFLDGGIYRTNNSGRELILVTGIDHADSRNKCFNSITFINESTGWVVGDSGVILKTVDSGYSWQRQPVLTTENLTKIKFKTARFGWISGGNKIFLTYDGGLTWKDKSIVSSTPVRDVFCPDEKNCWAVGDNGLIFHLTNKVDNLIIITAPEKGMSFKCGDSLIVKWSYEAETKMTIFLSYDGGLNYTMYKNLTDNDGEEILKISANAVQSNNCKVKIVNSDGKILGESELFSIVNSTGVLNDYKNTSPKISIINNRVDVSLHKNEMAGFRVFNIAGKEVYSKIVTSDGNKIITEYIPSGRINYGCYIIQINVGTEMLTKRVFIGNLK